MVEKVKIPNLGESITEATIAKWFKKEGDAVEEDEALCELETDKVAMEVNAPKAGVLSKILAGEGTDVEIGETIAEISEGEGKKDAGDDDEKKDEEENKAEEKKDEEEDKAEEKKDEEDKAEEKKAEKEPEEKTDRDQKKEAKAAEKEQDADKRLSPSAKRLAREKDISLEDIEGTGKGRRITKQDVKKALDEGEKPKAKSEAAQKAGEDEERVKMSRMRRRIAERLKDAQNTAAMLTTFNEVDMTAVMELRSKNRELFEQKHNVRLGFMSFFIKAAVHALKEIPAVNAEIDGEEIVYKNHYDIGVAVSTENGLLVPVVRGADRKGFAEIEAEISDFGKRARSGDIKLDELTGGTFSISNGGVFGSLLSTPILNPPQSGILGMHKIEKRPVVIDDEIQIRPMMYLALTYDHRIIDGREAVTFLVRIKELLEAPERLYLDI